MIPATIESGPARWSTSASLKPIVADRGDFRPSGDNEGTVVNLQIEHFIRASGGAIVTRLGAIARA